jgi:hypothetical protein
MQTDLNQCMGELVEQLPWIGDVASAKVALGGRVAPLWGQPVGPSGHKASYHVHLPLMCAFVTIFGQNSCIQIYFHVQVELGELKSKSNTCDIVFSHYWCNVDGPNRHLATIYSIYDVGILNSRVQLLAAFQS